MKEEIIYRKAEQKRENGLTRNGGKTIIGDFGNLKYDELHLLAHIVPSG